MATIKRRGRRELVDEKKQGEQKSGPKHPPFEDIIKDVFRDQEHGLGFTKDAILKILLSKYGIHDKNTVILTLNAALRNGLKNGTLKRISGTGMSGTFSLVDAKTELGQKGSKAKAPDRTRSQTSRVSTTPTTEDAQVSKMPGVDIKKSYDLRKRKSTTINKDIKSLKTENATNMKAPRGYVKKKVEKQLIRSSDEALFKVPETDTNIPKQTSSMETGSKASLLNFHVMGTSDPKPRLVDVPSSKATPFSVSATEKPDLNRSLFGMSDPNPTLINVSVTGTTSPKPTLFQVSTPKAIPFNDSATDKPDLNRTLFGMPDLKTTPVNDPVMDIIKSKPPSTQVQIENLQSSQILGEGMSESFEWPFKGFQAKRSLLIEMEPAVGLYGGGIAVLNDGKKLIADEITMRLYSPDMKLLSLLAFATQDDTERINSKTIKDIAIFNNTVAIVLLGIFPQIQFVDISNEVISVTRSLRFTGEYILTRLTACRGYIFVSATRFVEPSVVQKIDTAGEVCWSVSINREAEQFYNTANCIDSFVVDDCIRIVVTGTGRDASITLLDGESGDILFVRRIQDGIFGLTIDAVNNIYICNYFGWVSVLTSDLSRERIMLTTPMHEQNYSDALSHDLKYSPQRIAFDKKSNSLLVNYGPLSNSLFDTGGPHIDNHSATVKVYKFF